ncbi:MAG TPA: Lpg1974 family pore-forming outer membrane protein, partial [Caulobacteraceae bacterium]|nr:Lpg1974 family pore-forming outer membrane protein [Caulobacteraceae bacterium]
GQAQRHDASNAAVSPSFLDSESTVPDEPGPAFSPAIDPRIDQQDDLDWGDGRDVKLTYAPGDGWKASLGVRFGKTNGSMPWSERREEGFVGCQYSTATCEFVLEYYFYDLFASRENYSISTTADREEHMIVDFVVGKDIGVGAFGEGGSSTVSAGLRYADLGSTTSAKIFGTTNWNTPVTEYLGFCGCQISHDRFESQIEADRGFEGTGPVLSWEASKALLGNRDVGFLGLDWSLSGGMLFGDRETAISGQEVEKNYSDPAGRFTTIQGVLVHDEITTTPVSFRRSESATVPTYGATVGFSYTVDRFKVGAGYRWETYQDAIDGGYDEAQEEDRTIDGPYFKVSLGFGG